MYTIKFPDMLSATSTNLVEDTTATKENIYLLLNTTRTTLLGDPYFGTLLKEMLFEQTTPALKDLIIDEIHSCLATFIPQLRIERDSITLTVDKDRVYVTIKCFNILTYQNNLYQIQLITE